VTAGTEPERNAAAEPQTEARRNFVHKNHPRRADGNDAG
jgi:hypothetical protein